MHLKKLAEAVKAGIRNAGRVPFREELKQRKAAFVPPKTEITGYLAR
ncbi:Dihydroxy-acid dehydratase [Methanosarcina barkeri str. Wiesmoor]|uniref:Dihydroxy-acid dehydratase n=1 Tax=Methanosarcina barkeri str. Wiesmoor TaxID=1434109 RepID=A0A0E3QMZ5_METBA|nr:Dihydroxy-acid dehydratase [Methanosarcina barkeri str. Wiesmoor]